MTLKRLTMDFETRSRCELKKAGAYKYSLDGTTQPTCLAFKVRGEAKLYFLRFEVINRPWKELSKELRDLWTTYIAEGFEFSAHNAFFERCIYTNILVRRYGWPPIPVKSWRCTAAKAAAVAIPRNLEGAGEAMQLSVQKDKRGYNAMMATCKPTKQYNAYVKAVAEQKAGVRIGARKLSTIAKGEPEPFLEYDDNPETWETLYTYCKIDVKAEEKLDESLPDLIETEQEIWHLNQRLNWHGLRADIPTIEKIVGIMAVESKVKLKELDELTLGLVTKPGARKSILEFLALEDIILPDIRAKTVDDVLKAGKLSPDMRRLLEIRKALSKTSTKKYQGFMDRAGVDHRIRDILLYHGASTGRDTGTGVQPHNFPRGVIDIDPSRPYAAVENVVECEPEMLRILYGDSLSLLFSSILRNMLVPSEGHELFVADFSKIEVAVLWWLAGNEPGLKILRSGKDPYIYQAAVNTGKTYAVIEAAVKAEEKWALDARQLGKAQILGCGFGMGWEKFKGAAQDQYRLKLTSAQSRLAVKTYREGNEAVPVLWRAYERAAIMAIEDGIKVRAGKCVFSTKKGFLWVRLPSGRKLAYLDPRISWRVPTYDIEEHYHKGKWRRRSYFDPLIKAGRITEEDLAKKRMRTRQFQGEARKTVEFLGLDKSKKKMQRERTWGGTLTENIVQAVARDLMMPAMVRLEDAGYKALLMVHDEGICEKEKGKGSLDEFVKLLLQRPSWADKYLPLDAKGWVGPRYRK